MSRPAQTQTVLHPPDVARANLALAYLQHVRERLDTSISEGIPSATELTANEQLVHERALDVIGDFLSGRIGTQTIPAAPQEAERKEQAHAP